MTIKRITINWAVDRIAELLAQETVAEFRSSSEAATWKLKYGPEYDPLRRVVICSHPEPLYCISPGEYMCLGCLQQSFLKPRSRATCWEAAEARDPGVLYGALKLALASLLFIEVTWLTTGEWSGQALVRVSSPEGVLHQNPGGRWAAHNQSASLAALQAVIAALEAT